MKNGFTLIELLAVIVVLAIIALIAVPVVLNIINEAKESSLLRSAEFYLSAVDYTIADAYLYHGGLTDGTYPITEEGDVCKKALPCDDDNTLKVEVSGDKPTGGSITVEGGVISDLLLILDNKRIIRNEENKLIYDPNVCSLISGNKTIPGSKYMCEVKQGTIYNFYVLSQESDGTTNLIMERNICSDGTLATVDNKCTVAWVSKADYNDDANYGTYGNNNKGPVTATNYLNSATSSWSNIDNLDITYNDEEVHFNNFKITGKARLPYHREVNAVGCVDYEDLTCPVWMVDYLYDAGPDYGTTYQQNPINNIYGYWTLSSPADFSNSAWFVYYDGNVDDRSVYNDGFYGVRPVINLKL